MSKMTDQHWKPINGAKFSDGDSLELKYVPKENIEFESKASYIKGRFFFEGNLRYVIDVIIDALHNDRDKVFYRSKRHEQGFN